MKCRIKIQVTQEDIDNGVCGDSYWCPVANAMKRQFERAVRKNRITVGNDGCLWFNGTEYKYSTEVEEKINHFDSHGEMEPFEFEAWIEESQ